MQNHPFLFHSETTTVQIRSFIADTGLMFSVFFSFLALTYLTLATPGLARVETEHQILAAIAELNRGPLSRYCEVTPALYKKITDQGVPAEALLNSLRFLSQNGKSLKTTDRISIADFDPNKFGLKRFYMIDLKSGAVKTYSLAAGEHVESGKRTLGNEYGKRQTPPGFMSFGPVQWAAQSASSGKYSWTGSMPMKSLEARNADPKSGPRGILAHDMILHDGPDKALAKKSNYIGTTDGCLGFTQEDFKKIAPDLEGILHYNYQPGDQVP